MRGLKLLSFLLVVVMILPFAASCKNQKNDTALSIDEVKAILSGYKVVYSELRDSEQNAMICEAARAISDSFGLELAGDFVVGDVPQDNLEILVGATNRNASAEAQTKLSSERANYHNDFIIQCSEKKIVILGGSTRATVAAVKYFLENVVPTISEKKIKEFEHIHRAQISVTEIAGIPATNYSICVGNNEYASTMAIEIQSALLNATGYEMPIVKARKLESPAAIYLGADGAAEYDAVVNELKSYRENHLEDWAIKANGSGIIVAVTSSVSTEAAIKFFCEQILPKITSNQAFSDYIYRKEYSEVIIEGINIKDYSITADWNLEALTGAPSEADKYSKDTESSYSNWLQDRIFDKTGYLLPIVEGNTANTPLITISISHENGTNGGMMFSGSNVLIYGGRYASAAAAMDEFIKLIGTSIDLDSSYAFSKAFDTAVFVEGLYPTIDNALESSSEKRPVPTEFGIGEGGHYGSDGLAYYPMPEDAETTVSKLQGGDVIMTAGDWYGLPYKSNPNAGNPSQDNFGDYEVGGFYTHQGIPTFATLSTETVNDSSVPFDTALRINVTKLPDSTKSQYLNLRYYPNISEFGQLFEDGDVMLAKIYVKLMSGGDIATGTGTVDFSFSKYWASKQSANNFESGSVSMMPAEDGWYEYYVAFAPTHEYISDGFCFGFGLDYCVQDVMIGGFELINYGKSYTMDDMPINIPVYAGADEDAQWRKDALARIEQIRKGDITVIVQDENGNRIEGADVKVEMFEHEFDLGIQFSSYYLKYDKPDAAKFRDLIVQNFNSYGYAQLHKYIEDNEQNFQFDIAEEGYYWAMLNGCAQQLKGHALFWDAGASESISGDGTYDSTIDFYMQYIEAEDWDGLNLAIRSHFEWMAARFPYLTQWDVSNEDSSRNSGNRDWSALKKVWIQYLKNEGYDENYIAEHTYDYLIPIYDYAREYFPEAELVLNDIFQYDSTKYGNIQLPFLDWAYENLSFDAIGYQGHEGYNCDPEEVIKILDDLSAYGLPIHITEFNTRATAGQTVDDDQYYQANLVRDVLIAYFACENVESIYLWWPKDLGASTEGCVLADYNYNLTRAGLMYQDLFYNKWWTNEQGTTSSDGTFSTRGFYGEYTVTASKDGKTAAVDATCYKGTNNTIVITLK